ncbi:MAG: HPF/RaiA family ribosome-associated protein [Bdellovibrionaceae bacterium]|nr:HPF/RaiA family ribosome-associated protein [Pseudobdellovibrionaceae bacterium]
MADTDKNKNQVPDVQIMWGNIGRTEALEKYILQKTKKVLKLAPNATNLVISLSIENPINSAGVPEQKVDAELRIPKNQTINASKKGADIYKTILEVQHALLTQVNAMKSHRLAKRHEAPVLAETDTNNKIA